MIPIMMRSRIIFKFKGFLKAINISKNRISPNSILPKYRYEIKFSCTDSI